MSVYRSQGVQLLSLSARVLVLQPTVNALVVLRDEFTTDDAAPVATPRTAEPGPGTLTFVQNDGQMSISSGALFFPAQSTPADADQRFSATSQTRTAGLILAARVRLTANSQATDVGWYSSATTSFANRVAGFIFGGAGAREFSDSSLSIFGAFDLSTDYDLAVVLRGTGHFLFVKGGSFSTWTFVWPSDTGAGATVHPSFSNYDGAGSMAWFRVLRFLETFSTDFGYATQRLAGSQIAGTTFVHEADCIIQWTMTTRPSSGSTEIRFRIQDASNYWRVTVSSSGALDLAEVVAGTPTSRGNVAGAVVTGNRVVIACYGSTIKIWKTSTMHITYASASNFAAETDGVLQALGTSGVVSDIVSWPRIPDASVISMLDQSVTPPTY